MAKTRSETIIVFVLLLGVLIPLELLCALLAYETIGEITSSLYVIGVIGLNSLFIVMAFRYRTVATLGVVVLALFIIPYQVILGQRLLRVQAEVTHIVSYAYEQRIHSSAFPSDLSGYAFHDTAMEVYIQRYQLDQTQEQFTVFYRVGTENTSHWYSSTDGWGYYPD